MKKAFGVCMTSLLVLGLAFTGATAASADDATVEPTTAETTVIEEAPVAPEVPVVAEVVEPVVVSEPIIEAEAPAAAPVEEAPAPAAKSSIMTNGPPAIQPMTGQETCAKDGGWIKTDLAATDEIKSLPVTAPTGKLIAEVCVKSSTVIKYTTIDPALATVTLESPAFNSNGMQKAISHYALRLIDAPVVVVPTCTENLFKGYENRGGMWEVTYGMQHTDTNGVAVFTNDSYGGLVAFNEGPIPDYMTGENYRWLYVYGDQPNRTWTWDFEDGTRVTAVANLEGECPMIEWAYGETPLPDPIVCEGAGDWYTEHDDVAPSLTPEGYVFDSTDSKVSGLRQTATGNLQGWGTVDYTATGDLDSFWYRIVIDASADGGNAYTSATVTSGAPVTSSSVAYVSKLGKSMTLAELAEVYPNNVITSVGFHLDRKAGDVLLSSVSGDCGTVDFTTDKPQAPGYVYGDWTEPVITCDNEVGDTLAIEQTVTKSKYVWEDGKWVLHEDTVIKDGTYTVTAEDIEALDCPLPEVPEEPEEPVTPVTPENPVTPTAERLAMTYDPTVDPNAGLVVAGFLALLGLLGIGLPVGLKLIRGRN